MRRLGVALLLAVLIGLAAGAAAHAQSSPAPLDSPPAVVEDQGVEDQGDDGGGRPWGRLLVFVPLSILIGAGAVYGRRAARERGWIQS